MIVPRSRLLFAVVLVLPFTVLMAAIPSTRALCLGLLTALALIAFLDAMLAQRGLRGISVQLPDLVRLSKDKEGEIPILIKNDAMKKRQLRLGLPFPPEIQSAQEDVAVTLPEASTFSRALWLCTPVRRGRYVFDRCYVEAPSPVGFWGARSGSPSRMEIRVYPNLTEERKKVAALFLNRGDSGIHTQRIVGQGHEFEKLREYVFGDDYDQIHWKATARRGRPITKVFQIERTQEVYVVLDSSRLTAKEIRSETILEHFVKAALILGAVAQQQGDLFGLLTFSNKVLGFVRAGNGKAHYNTCRDALYMLHPQIVTPDYEEMSSFVRLRLRRRALLVILTDLNDPILAESFVRSTNLIARQHLLLVNMVRPFQARPLFAEPDADSVDRLYQNLSGHLLWQNLRELHNVLHKHGITLKQLDDAKMSAEIVTQYLNVKQRQML